MLVLCRKLFLGIVAFAMILCLGKELAAQNRVHFGLGYNQSYASLDSMNYVFNAFNAENSWATKPFHEIHAPGGVTAHLGADLAGILFDVGYTMRFASTKAKGESGNSTQIAQVRYNASTVDLGLGVFLLRKIRLRLATGGELNFGNLKMSGRRGNVGLVESQIYGRYINELNFGATAFMHWMLAFQDGIGPGIFIRPYYQFSLRQNDYAPLNKALRPQASLSDPLFILGKQSNIGLKIGLFFGS